MRGERVEELSGPLKTIICFEKLRAVRVIIFRRSDIEALVIIRVAGSCERPLNELIC